MQSVTELADEIIGREGGYVDDPDDPGGPTNHGVTLGTLRGLGKDVDGDGAVTSRDVRKLSREQARDLLINHYYHRPRIDMLPALLQPSVFDMQVNAGAQAVRILQRLLNAMGARLAVDGRIGPKTIAAARGAAESAPDHLADAYGIERRNYYYALADRRPSARKFVRRRDGGKGGWIRRAEHFISPIYRFSPEQHRERTAPWD